jgi:DNA-binding response OmpR family regulator
MLTASSHPKDIERTRRLAANDYVVKPLGFAEFVQLIKTMRDRWLMPPPAAPNRTKHVPARTMLNA